mgnify:CR=1 FL=1|jgi:hypothetical protein
MAEKLESRKTVTVEAKGTALDKLESAYNRNVVNVTYKYDTDVAVIDSDLAVLEENLRVVGKILSVFK